MEVPSSELPLSRHAYCPCSPSLQDVEPIPISVLLASLEHHRWLNEEDDDEVDNEAWEIAYTCIVLTAMFAALVSDRLGADSVMVTALTAFLVAQIITVEEALEGFANEGLWTVMVLFVVAEGISKTGALDWYMSKLLGRPATLASAQLRLMAPIAVVSAFLNNTPVVAVMIPIVQKWAQNIRQSPQQLLIPLSFASILGGTCTLIGTSTNLVVVGLLEDRYPNDSEVDIGLFDLGQFGVPVALAGLAYILLLSPFLLPGGSSAVGNASVEADQVLLGARLTPWSPAVNRTVQRSGLRDTGGIYLVSVQRAATGNVHRAVSKDFVLNVGDILYFTAAKNVELFGDFCAEHGLEVLTNEVQDGTTTEVVASSAIVEADLQTQQTPLTVATAADGERASESEACEAPRDPSADLPSHLADGEADTPSALLQPQPPADLETILEDEDMLPETICGCTKESLLQADYDELKRNINRMTDLIRNAQSTESQRSMLMAPDYATTTTASGTTLVNMKQRAKQRPLTVDGLRGSDPPKIVVTVEKELVVVGINARDRAGLLLDISKGLLRLDLQLHHTEAAVIVDRSVSIWRCSVQGTELPDVEQIWSVLSALLSSDVGVEAMKKRGLRVLRAKVIVGSRLIGKTAQEVNFRQRYKTAIVALRQAATGQNITTQLSTIPFEVGDVLILQVSDDSPLLNEPPKNFYKELEEAIANANKPQGSSSVQNLVNLIRRRSSGNLDTMDSSAADDNGSNSDTKSQGGAAASEDDDQEEVVFYVGDGAEELSEALEPETPTSASSQHADEAAQHRKTQQEKVWKDLMVMFNDDESGDRASREFLTAMAIAPGSKFAGKTVAQAGIHKLPDLFLVSIERPRGGDGEDDAEEMNGDGNHGAERRRKIRTMLSQWHHPHQAHHTDEESAGVGESDTRSVRTDHVAFEAIDPETPLREGDVLWFSGSASAVGDLRKIPGLIQYQNEEVEKINERVHDRRLVQAVVARNGPLVGKTVKELRFRTRYGAAVIAVHREGRRVHEHPGRVKLQAGDVLLLEAGPSFIGKSAENDRAFALLAEVKNSAPPRLELLIPALLIALTMLAVFTAGVTSLLICALVASVLMVAIGILSEQEARDALKWDIFITIASAFGIGTALVNSGVAGGIADFLVNVGEGVGLGDAGLLGSVYFATFLISNVVTNNAAAALLFPIAMDAAEQTGTDRVIMSYALMLGASASFMSPFGYTTNLLIYGPGGYKYKDFLRFGTPMQIVLWILSTIFLVVEQWYISWVVTFALLVVAAFLRISRASPSGGATGAQSTRNVVK